MTLLQKKGMTVKYRMHHAQVTVRNIDESEKFYDVLMPALGFDINNKYKGYLDYADMAVVEYLSEDFDFGICSPKPEFKDERVDSRKPGALQHLAFNAESREAVDEVFETIKALGINILHNEPRVYTKLGPEYYALFFEDPDGVRLEVFFNGKERSRQSW